MIDDLEAIIADTLAREVNREQFFDVLYSSLTEQFADNLQKDALLAFYTPQLRSLADTVCFKFNADHLLVIDRDRLSADGRNMVILLERGSHNLEHLYRVSELALVSA